MRRRLSGWLLLFCALILLCAIVLLPDAGRLRPDALENRFDSAASHYTVSGGRMLLDINRATEAEIAELPGIGDTLAARIIEYRGRIGGFADISQLMNVQGIGKGKLEGIENSILIRP